MTVTFADIQAAQSRIRGQVDRTPVRRSRRLSQLTGAISDLKLDIRSAHITTFGEKVIDSFYVTDLVGQKIEDTARQGRIRKALLSVLKNDQRGATKKQAGKAAVAAE